ncbi:MAG: hypothetical protein KDE19_05000 [Caldilineaceae bacterium]|nr:hypothetical protein [Caldilineaceae bacterium]
MNNDEQNPSWETLVNFVDGRLTSEEAKSVEEWTIHNAESGATVVWLRALKRVGREVALDEPPRELRSALRTTFADYASRMAERASAPSLVERLVAVLSFDSGLQPGLAGARGPAEATRQLVYSADAADITLTIQQGTAGLQIHGQLLPIADVAPEEFQVQLQQKDEIVQQAAVDPAGQFVFSAIEPNTYQLLFQTGTLTILVESAALQI